MRKYDLFYCPMTCSLGMQYKKGKIPDSHLYFSLTYKETLLNYVMRGHTIM